MIRPLTVAEITARRIKIDVILRNRDACFMLLTASHEFRHAALRGASRRQLAILLAFARRWREGLEQTHADFAARRFRKETLDDSRDELHSVVADSLPRHKGETKAAYASRITTFVHSLRGRMEPA